MKKKLDIKKLVLLNFPYVFAFYFVDKLAAVFRLAPGTEFIDKLTGGFANFGAAFANPLPSFHPDVYKRQSYTPPRMKSNAIILSCFNFQIYICCSIF